MKLINKIPLSAFLFAAIFLMYCNETTTPSKIDYKKAIIGNWKIVESFTTNGPICYFLEQNGTVKFESDTSENGIYFNFNTGFADLREFFTYTVDGNRILGTGSYIKQGSGDTIIDTNTIFPQYLEITFENNNTIHCLYRMGVIDNDTKEITVGDISNFIAKKQ